MPKSEAWLRNQRPGRAPRGRDTHALVGHDRPWSVIGIWLLTSKASEEMLCCSRPHDTAAEGSHGTTIPLGSPVFHADDRQRTELELTGLSRTPAVLLCSPGGCSAAASSAEVLARLPLLFARDSGTFRIATAPLRHYPWGTATPLAGTVSAWMPDFSITLTGRGLSGCLARNMDACRLPVISGAWGDIDRRCTVPISGGMLSAGGAGRWPGSPPILA